MAFKHGVNLGKWSCKSTVFDFKRAVKTLFRNFGFLSLRKNESVEELSSVNKPILSKRKSDRFLKDILTPLEVILNKVDLMKKLYFAEFFKLCLTIFDILRS